MQCPKCGWQNPDNATECNNCFTEMTPAAPQQPQPTQQMPQQPYAQQPQQPYGQQPYTQQPYAQGALQNVPDHTIWSVIITIVSLFCCCYLPVPVAFGIVAIVKSSQANNKKAMGDYLGALRESNAAKTWLYWAAGLDIAGLIVDAIIVVLAASSGHHTQ